MREWPHLLLAGKARYLGKQRTLAVQDHQGIPRGGASGFLPPTPFSEATCCNCVAAREAAERGRGMGYVRVTGTAGHDQVRQRMLAEPSRDGGQSPVCWLGAEACCVSASEAMARARATAAYRPGASTVTTLMMVSAVCGVTMLADLRHAAWLAAAARLPGAGNWPLSRDRAREDAVRNHGVF